MAELALPPQILALIESSATASALIAEKDRRQDDLRKVNKKAQDKYDAQNQRWRNKLDAERERSAGLALRAEAGRLDALLLENTRNVALALGKAEGTAQAQDRRIAVLEANQYQSGGANLQRTEQRGQSNVDRSLIVAVVVGLASIAGAYIALHH